jgi:hypothetical protein
VIRHPVPDQYPASGTRHAGRYGAVDPDRDADPAAGDAQLRRRSGSFRHDHELNLGIGLCHPPVGSILFVGCAVGKVSMEDVMRKIWPFYGVMFFVLMLVTYLPEVSLWLPRHVLH